MAKANLLERALSAEEELESSRNQLEKLEHRLRNLLNGKAPFSAERAVAWVNRAENAEQLLADLMLDLRENPSLRDLLPTGWVNRVEAQMRSLQILQRDHAALGENPGEQWWGEDNPYGSAVRVGGNPQTRRLVPPHPPLPPHPLSTAALRDLPERKQ